MKGTKARLKTIEALAQKIQKEIAQIKTEMPADEPIDLLFEGEQVFTSRTLRGYVWIKQGNMLTKYKKTKEWVIV